MADNYPIVVNEDEAARMVGLSTRTLQRLRVEGRGPAFVRLTEKRVGYPVAELHAWVAARSTASTSAATAA